MEWLGLRADAGPYFQTRRFERYKQVLEGMLQARTAYLCYCTKQELDALREQQVARKEKPRYAGVCRERTEPRPGVDPVVRFRNPLDGVVVVQDLVHGPVTFQNAELDDLIIARSDGTPTYNFSVVVDDMEMGITHAAGARRDLARLRARPHDPRRRWREAIQAARCGERPAI